MSEPNFTPGIIEVVTQLNRIARQLAGIVESLRNQASCIERPDLFASKEFELETKRNDRIEGTVRSGI